METKTTDYVYESVSHIENAEASRRFIANVFVWMFAALALSAACAYYFAYNKDLSSLIRNPETGANNIWGTVVMISPLIIVFLFRPGLNRLSLIGVGLMFMVFSALMGISLSSIFYNYPPELIASAFATSSIVFGVMAVGGYTTQQDLTKFGSILIMLLVGGLVATFLNLLVFRSSSFDLLISYLFVAVFVGLTAYDVQKLKRIGAGIEYGDAAGKKTAIMGALTLYLDFINLFLLLLRIFGGNRR
ncbi:Bax inhibitor-1/YccA family protein [Mucilaginibacter terrigena]|uniref:Bax inhibitor-1/YccA family protein n=1 Tax=Mucilaginibacter terrigena TaxID=2492395 RepID=A0A4Q5LI06_9SPHI|nr:Bax inhibitor-1/YccA family protein [Mucilaginibacter terrigena]RYU87351.1 Bax inhibitor-1/YccA family protein [Mucilaginibacter terrigena]